MSTAKECVRDLAREVADVANSDRMASLREMWRRHNSLEKVDRPPVICRYIAWNELIPPESIVSSDPLWRQIEMTLRTHLCRASLGDDGVIEPWIDVDGVHTGPDRPTMWGVNIDTVHPDQAGGSFTFKPEIADESDIAKLKVPTWGVDEPATAERHEKAVELLGDILDVRMSYGRLDCADLAYWGSYLRGLEQMMYDCVDRPEWLNRLMKFLSDAHIQHWRGLEADGRLLRNDIGGLNRVPWYCDDLPRSDFDEGSVRLSDKWCWTTSQEFTLVSPQQWDEFVLQHQLPILKLHALTDYGCCESLVGKIEILRAKVPNLRRVAVSPWSDIEHMAEHCGRDVVMQIRPMPSDVIMNFDEDDMRRDIRRKMERAGDTIFDFCLQDVQTLNNRPDVLTKWIRAAKEVGAEMCQTN